MPASDVGRSITRRRVSRRDFLTRSDGGSLIFPPHLGNIGARAIRRTDGYGASTVAGIWSDE